MCDYSLMSIPNRLAREGDELVVHRFETGAIGLAADSDLRPSPDEPAGQPRTFWSAVKEVFTSHPKRVPAVCVPPGTDLLLRDIPKKLQNQFGVKPIEQVTFTQITATVNRYRDAVSFHNGHHVLLQDLQEGQRVRVLAADFGQATV